MYKLQCGDDVARRIKDQQPTPIDHYAIVFECLAHLADYNTLLSRPDYEIAEYQREISYKLGPIKDPKALLLKLTKETKAFRIGESIPNEVYDELFRRRVKAYFMKNKLNNHMQAYVNGRTTMAKFVYVFPCKIDAIALMYKNEFYRNLISQYHNPDFIISCFKYAVLDTFPDGVSTDDCPVEIMVTQGIAAWKAEIQIKWEQSSAEEIRSACEDILRLSTGYRPFCVVLKNDSDQLFPSEFRGQG